MACTEPAGDPKFTAVSTQWPTNEEIATAGRIRKANEQALARLKDPAQDVVGDLRIVRFLRARHMKEAEATEWYGDFLKLRLEECPEIETKIRPAVIGMSPTEFMDWFNERSHPSLLMYPWVGFTLDRHGVFIGRPGMIDAVKFTEERGDIPLSQDRLLMIAFLEWTLWYLDEECHRQKKMLYVIKVMDMNGLGAGGRKPPPFVPKMKEWMTTLLQCMQKPYCEHDAMFIVINAPFIFRMVFSIISIALTAKQKSKFKFLGNTSDASVREQIFQYIPAQHLPKEIGGELAVLPNVYPPRDDSAIQAWISRVQTMEFWPPRLATSARAPAAGASASAESPTTEADGGKCRSCGNKGVDFMGKTCTCEYGKALAPPATTNAEDSKIVPGEAVEVASPAVNAKGAGCGCWS